MHSRRSKASPNCLGSTSDCKPWPAGDAISPFDLLVADHLLRFSPVHLGYLASRAGLSISILRDDLVPKEITLLAELGGELRARPAPAATTAIVRSNLAWLAAVAGTGACGQHGFVSLLPEVARRVVGRHAGSDVVLPWLGIGLASMIWGWFAPSCRNWKEACVQRYLFKEAILKPFIRVMFVSLTLTAPALAEKLVDPTTVAPEYREAAEKRRAEQIRQQDCAHKADIAKVMPRERTAFLLQCLEADAANR
jgi:hypothetical protein